MSSLELLVNDCRKRDAKAQKMLYSQFSKKMFLHCLRFLKQKEDAQDILVRGFVKVFEKIPLLEYQGDKAFESWMRKIFINEALMFLRQRKDVIFFDHSELPEVEAFEDNFSNLCAADIFALIATLPTGLNTVFNLYAIEGYSHFEISELLGITESTSRSQLVKARRALQKALNQNHPENESRRT